MNDEARDYVADLLAHRVVEHDSARLHRVHIQLRPGGCAEFFGTYVRGARVRAFAGRIEPPASGGGARAASSRADRRWVVAEFGIV